ncbi:class I SAM-dependent methyltransferase [Mucilaginibacter lacusdianchii]|uniref:class I SAM-dependent methyltransferase n=1 Tax=Mucilaginibacter lacusdianchii TaxID=2684211 RepID=UPI00131D0C1E|nr:class I SAM-dependent methyltransferase [Mucilaginibacter sp. JXJ CY 39]
MAANYDRTAWFYDRLSYLVFGKAQVNAQSYFLNLISPGSRILIVGGGTGRILEILAANHPTGLHITYVEVSANMTALARRRKAGHNHVEFIIADINSYTSTVPFDAIITAFLFDNFTEERLQQTFAHLHQQLKPNGIWLDTDFQLTGPFWQRLMLQSMYLFFKIWGAVQVAGLPDTSKLFNRYQYLLSGQKTFFGKFISAKAYRRQA